MKGPKKPLEEEELNAIYKARLKDRAQYKSRRAKMVENPPQQMADLLTALFKGNPETINKIEENRALMAWEGFVGTSAARVSKAVKLRGDQLVVKVTDPLWMQQLSLLKHELIRKYRVAFPKLQIRDIFFKG